MESDIEYDKRLAQALEQIGENPKWIETFKFFPGWYKLIGTAVFFIRRAYERESFWKRTDHKRLDPSFKIIQVKEKFGGLRFYIAPKGEESFTSSCQSIVDFAESMAFTLCMDCGTNQEVTNAPLSDKPYGWVLNLCSSCREERLGELDATS